MSVTDIQASMDTGTVTAALVAQDLGLGHRKVQKVDAPADFVAIMEELPAFLAKLNDAELRLLRDELRQIARELKAAAELRRMVQEQIGAAFEELATAS